MRINNFLWSLSLLVSLSVNSQTIDVGRLFIQSFLQEKDFSKAYAFFDESIKDKISEAMLKDTAEKLESQLGKFKSIIEINNEKNVFYYYSDFDKMKLDIQIAFSDSGKITGFHFVPHKEFKNENSLGKELDIKSDKEIELKGTLLLPENQGKRMSFFNEFLIIFQGTQCFRLLLSVFL